MTYEAYILFFSGFRSNIVSSIKIALSSKKKVWLKNEITVGRDKEDNFDTKIQTFYWWK